MRTFTKMTFVLATYVAFALQVAPLRADETDKFTRQVRDALGKALPGYRLELGDPLTIKVYQADGKSLGDVALDRVYHYALLNPEHEADVVENFAHRMAQTLKEENAPPEVSSIRVVVRPLEYMQDAVAKMSPGPKAAFWIPLTKHLVEVPVLDLPTSWKFVSDLDCEALHLSEQQVIAIGEKNLRDVLKPFPDYKIPKKGQIGSAEEEYASSRVLLHDQWKSVVDKIHGELVVMVPSSNLVLFVEGSTRTARDALNAIGSKMAESSEKPLSPLLLEWTKDGWVEVDI